MVEYAGFTRVFELVRGWNSGNFGWNLRICAICTLGRIGRIFLGKVGLEG